MHHNFYLLTQCTFFQVQNKHYGLSTFQLWRIYCSMNTFNFVFIMCTLCRFFFNWSTDWERVCHEYTCFNSHQVHPIYPMKITAEKSVNTRKKAKHFFFQFLFFTQYSYIRSQCQIEIRPPLWQESMIFPSNLKCCFTCIT